MPAVDIKEDTNKFMIQADIPSAKPEEVDITIPKREAVKPKKVNVLSVN